MKKFKNFAGFSLVEMMVVLLIVAVVMAASAPMISKKMIKTSESSPWEWIGNQGSIGFNLGNRDVSAIIGATAERVPTSGAPSRLYIESDDAATNPQIRLFGGGNVEPLSIGYTNRRAFYAGTGINNSTGNNSIIIGPDAVAESTNAIAIGYTTSAQRSVGAVAVGSANTSASNSNGAVVIGQGSKAISSENSVAIGSYAKAQGTWAIAIGGSNYEANNPLGAYASGTNTIAIGPKASTNQNDAIAIGASANVTGAKSIAIGPNSKSNTRERAIAIGDSANASGTNAIAIGYNASASHNNSVAIGAGAVANQSHQIVLGTTSDTVYIPGKLYVAGNVELGTETASRVRIRAPRSHQNNSDSRMGIVRTDFNSYTMYLKDTAISDRRLKNVGEVFKGGLAEINKLEIFHFTYKKDEDKTPHVGVMAQDLQKIFPDAVIKGEDGFLRIRMEDMFYALVNAVKELDAKVTAIAEQVKSNVDLIAKLQDKVQVQEKQITELQKQNEEFEKRLAKLEK